MTCAPATMAAVGRFWNKATDHLSVVDAICYDGTAAYSQREWAQKNGWIAREFTVNGESAIALIDRGIPFMLATTQVTSAHLQAVIGYDKMRGTMLCRDPYQYYVTEFHAQMLLEQQAAHGPRAMVIVPDAQGHLLQDLELPDSKWYDYLYQVEATLSRHDRTAAAAAALQLSEGACEHRLAFQAQRALAAYDRDNAASLLGVEGLLKTYPKDPPLLYCKAALLRVMERSDLLLPFLAELCGTHSVEASFLHLYAEQLQLQTTDRKPAVRLLKRSLRRQPLHAKSLAAMGNHLWSERKLEKATGLYQLAASVDSMNEEYARSYFIASRHLKKSESALALLKKRYERWIVRSSQPARTYFWALEELNRNILALEVLNDAQSMRPQDGELLLHAADAYGRRANFSRAREALQLASGKTHQSQWLRTSARLSAYEGDLLTSLSTWNQVLESEPLAVDANGEVARLIAQTQAPEAAAQHLQSVIERFPFNTNLAEIQITWLRSRGYAAVAEAAAGLVARQPNNVWARVELSLSLTELGKTEEAAAHARAAMAISPHATNALYAHANALERMLKLDEARESYRQAIRISVDYSSAIHRLIESYGSLEEKREGLAFVHQELLRQVVFGDGLLTYRKEAVSVIEPETLLTILKEARSARPDLWQSWSMVVYQLASVSRLDEALPVAREAVELFPLLPRVWYDLSYVAGLRAERPGKIAALIQCLTLSPGWSFAARQLADTYRLEGNDTEALAVLERAIHYDPLDAANYHARAWQLWNVRKKEAAIEQARKAVVLQPGLANAWQSLQSWMRETGKEAELVEFTREICRQRAGEAETWLILARVLRGPQTLEERLKATDSAISLAPLDTSAHDQKVLLLMEQGSIDAAVDACDPPQFSGNPPVELRGRRAWIYARQKDVPKAIATMKQLVASNKTYRWGWGELVNWQSELKMPEQYLATAEAMVAQFPHDTVARNHLSAAQLQNKNSATAKQTLISTVNVSPDNAYALGRLFDAQIKDKELTRAAETLKLIERHMAAPEFLNRQIHLATAACDSKTAAAALSKLCTREVFRLNALVQAVKAMDTAKMQKSVNEALNTAASGNADLPLEVVQFWVQRAAGSRQWTSWAQLPICTRSPQIIMLLGVAKTFPGPWSGPNWPLDG